MLDSYREDVTVRPLCQSPLCKGKGAQRPSLAEFKHTRHSGRTSLYCAPCYLRVLDGNEPMPFSVVRVS